MNSLVALNPADMKYIKFFIFLTILAIVCACQPKPEYMLTQMVSSRTTTNSFSGFEVYNTITLADEVKEEIEHVKWSINWDENFYKSFTGYSNDTEIPDQERLHYHSLADKCMNDINKGKEILAYLDSVNELYPELYNEVSFTIYKLSYLAMNKDGNKSQEVCFGKFNKNGQLTAFKMTGTSNWEIIGNNCSIPGYERYSH